MVHRRMKQSSFQHFRDDFPNVVGLSQTAPPWQECSVSAMDTLASSRDTSVTPSDTKTKLPILLLVQLYDSNINCDCKLFSLAPPLLSSAKNGSISYALPCNTLQHIRVPPTQYHFNPFEWLIWALCTSGDSKSSPVLVLWLQVVTQIIFISVTLMSTKWIWNDIYPNKGNDTLSQNFGILCCLELHLSELMIPRRRFKGSRDSEYLKIWNRSFRFPQTK